MLDHVSRYAKNDSIDVVNNVSINKMNQSSYEDLLPLTKSGDYNQQSGIDVLETENVFLVRITYENRDLAKYILDNNLQNTFDKHDHTPLMVCIKFDCIHAVCELLEKGVDPNFHKEGEVTPLLLATYKYCHDPNDVNEELVHALISHGADIHMKDSMCESPYSLLKERGKLSCFGLGS